MLVESTIHVKPLLKFTVVWLLRREPFWFTTVPADVPGRLFVGAVDEKDWVVAWYVAPCEGRVDVDPNGPQAGVHGHEQDQDLKGWIRTSQSAEM